MDDNRRMLLTEEVLGECWHESKDGRAVGKIKLSGGISLQTCYKCKAVMSNTYQGVNENRTFTSWQDLGDLKEKIVEMGEWDGFMDYVYAEWPGNLLAAGKLARFTYWLFNPSRFAELCASWWAERKVKG